MEIYPEKYDQLELTSNERSFLRTVSRAFNEDELGYYVLHINPRKIGLEGGKPELFNLLICKEGLLLLRFFDVDNVNAVKMTIELNAQRGVFDKIENDIYEKLKGSRYLLDFSGELLFNFNICFVFPEVVSSQVLSQLTPNGRAFVTKHVLFKDTILAVRKEGESVLKRYISRRNFIEEKIINNIFQRLCPEITIARKYILSDDVSVTTHDKGVDGSDRSVLSYRLDSSQINIINKIKKGDQLILACAGSGKSVLLISKCFKLASLNPAEDFLITCYNRNLNNYYQWAIAQAGFLNRNVKCQTFFGLLRHLLESNHIPIPTIYNGDTNEYFDALFKVANDALAKGRIKERFTGIFIDEIQIFKPEWYRFCFNLLKNKNAENHFFVIAGDKSQDIKNHIKSGKAPWQGNGEGYPEYRGKTLPIETNYRNSKPINDAVDRYVEKAKWFGEKIGADLSSDPELFLRGTAYREGNSPEIIELKDFSNEGEAEAICRAVKHLIENKDMSEVDIAIILYNRIGQNTHSGWKTKFYNLLPYIKQRFYSYGWEDPAVLISGESNGVTYGSRTGVTITTIEGSLGLDFRAVILAGLRPLGSHEGVQTTRDFSNLTTEKQEAYKKNINFIYTGCTRAKDELSIVLSAKRGESVYMDLIRDSMGDDN